MSDWDPYSERTKQVQLVSKAISENIGMIALIVTVVCLCLTAVLSAHIYRTNQVVPCERVERYLEKLEQPSYYELRPIAKPKEIIEREIKTNKP